MPCSADAPKLFHVAPCGFCYGSLLVEEHIVKPAEAFTTGNHHLGHNVAIEHLNGSGTHLVVWDITNAGHGDLARSPKFESPINHTRVPGTHGRGNILVAGFGAFVKRWNTTYQHNAPCRFNQHVLAYFAPPLEAVALLPDRLFHLFARASAANKQV